MAVSSLSPAAEKADANRARLSIEWFEFHPLRHRVEDRFCLQGLKRNVADVRLKPPVGAGTITSRKRHPLIEFIYNSEVMRRINLCRGYHGALITDNAYNRFRV